MKHCFILSAVLLLAMQLKAQAPNELNYQGVARNANGTVVASQVISTRFTIHQGAPNGTIEYQETHVDTTNQFGLFSLAIGAGTVVSGSMAAITWGANSQYLQVEMDPKGGNSFIDMGTTKFLSVPYALYSSSSSWPWVTNGTAIHNGNTGPVGIGITTPINTASLEVCSSNTYSAFFNTNSNGGIIYGASAMAFDSLSGTAYGLYGAGSSQTGVGYGVYGVGVPTGVYGTASGTGVVDTNLQSFTNKHVVGVVGEITGAPSFDVTDESDGVLAVSNNVNADASVGSFDYGAGSTGNDYGTYTVAQTNGNNNYAFALYASVNPAGGSSGFGDYAGYFSGDVTIEGALTATTKNFKIDDPIDPANKYLYHTCVESPDMLNEYNGNIITDANGNAIVELPRYFDAENKDFKYQLTVIGQFAQAIVATEINNNQFTIKTDKPNVKVSWQVTGVRNDPWANKNRTVAEVDKKGIEKGHYLFPELYGQPHTMSIAYLMSATNKGSLTLK